MISEYKPKENNYIDEETEEPHEEVKTILKKVKKKKKADTEIKTKKKIN